MFPHLCLEDPLASSERELCVDDSAEPTRKKQKVTTEQEGFIDEKQMEAVKSFLEEFSALPLDGMASAEVEQELRKLARKSECEWLKQELLF